LSDTEQIKVKWNTFVLSVDKREVLDKDYDYEFAALKSSCGSQTSARITRPEIPPPPNPTLFGKIGYNVKSYLTSLGQNKLVEVIFRIKQWNRKSNDNK